MRVVTITQVIQLGLTQIFEANRPFSHKIPINPRKINVPKMIKEYNFDKNNYQFDGTFIYTIDNDLMDIDKGVSAFRRYFTTKEEAEKWSNMPKVSV